MNPKDKIGKTKLPLWIFPPVALIYGVMALVEGGIKYSPFNWRVRPISKREYVSALKRHIEDIESGEDIDQTSMVEHLGHIIATAGIMLDAKYHGTLIEDIPKGRSVSKLMEELRNHPLMIQLQEKGFAELTKEKEECQTGQQVSTGSPLYKR